MIPNLCVFQYQDVEGQYMKKQGFANHESDKLIKDDDDSDGDVRPTHLCHFLTLFIVY